MDQSLKKVGDANQRLERLVHAMKGIQESSNKISKINRTVDEIAFQTNILALNAAVEAARAGEAGLGFAVVADEVRTLAQRSALAAKETASLIEESITRSDEGRKKVDEVVEAIVAITRESGKARELVDEVNLGSQEQARGIEQITRAISQMEQVTQSTAAGAEECASASQEMTGQVRHVNTIIGSLEELVGVKGGLA
jgi:methyl-accepting chemotaxis protein/methyl-accepting chemotaxis protein-1 (serine sensor receptor)